MLVCANHAMFHAWSGWHRIVFTCEFQITMVVKSTTVYWTVKAIAVVGWTLRCGARDFPVPFTLSTDAGAYLCNETYHATMKAVCERPSTDPVPEPVLFLHLPGETKLSVEQGVAMVESCLAYMLRPYPLAPHHVVAAALSSNGGDVLVGQRSEEADGLLWEFPGGKCERNESWSRALERELVKNSPWMFERATRLVRGFGSVAMRPLSFT